jgi:hypothetical protein
VGGNGYQRAPLGAFVRIAYPADYALVNARATAFPRATGQWGEIKHSAIFDAPTSGNMLFFGTIEPQVTIYAHDRVVIKPGELAVGFSGASGHASGYEFGELIGAAVLNHILNGATLSPPALLLALQVGDDETYRPIGITGGWSAPVPGDNGGYESFNNTDLYWGTAQEAWPYNRLVVELGMDDWFCFLQRWGSEPLVPIYAGDQPKVSAGAIRIRYL